MKAFSQQSQKFPSYVVSRKATGARGSPKQGVDVSTSETGRKCQKDQLRDLKAVASEARNREQGDAKILTSLAA